MSANNTELYVLSPLDGRYHSQLDSLSKLFSEFALIKYRVHVEVLYLLFLSDEKIIPSFSVSERKKISSTIEDFSAADVEEIKNIENKVKHDVKAVEYFLQSFFQKNNLSNKQYVHIALTSEDINALAYGLMLQAAKKEVLIPTLKEVMAELVSMAERYASVPMLARTHGQPAVPTTMGKELLVFAARLYEALIQLDSLPIKGKLTGAVGNFNAHNSAFPNHNWVKLSSKFIQSLGLEPQLITTQIIPAETYTQFFSVLQQINLILLDLSQDFWRYISDGIFVQTLTKDEVGSSTMPQKINPIDFENCEGNLGLANALFTFFIQKLPISRLQRDLSDSTVKRNFGVAIGYSLVAYRSVIKGLKKLSLNTTKLEEELDNHWEVVTEGIQIILKRHGVADAYEQLKAFSRGNHLTKTELNSFIQNLTIAESLKKELLALTPFTYTGYAERLVHEQLPPITNYLKGQHGSSKNKKK